MTTTTKTTTTKTKRNAPNKGGGPYPYTTSAGTKLWHFVATVKGPDGTRRKVHKRGFTTSKEALVAMRKVLTASDEGGYTDPSRQPLEKYLATWLSGLQLAPLTVASYKKIVRLHITPYLGSVPLAQLTPATLTAHWRKLEKSGRTDGQGGLSPRTVRFIAAVLSGALRDAVDGGQLAVNPVIRSKSPTAKQATSPEFHPWTTAQLSAFLAWAKDNSALYPAWYTLAMTGARRGEVLALRWRDVDLDAGTITVMRNATMVRVKGEGAKVVIGPPKSGKPRVIDIDVATVALLKGHKASRGSAHLHLAQPDSLVFGDTEGKVRHPEVFSRKWRQTVTKAIRAGVDVPGVRLHDLRHGHLSDLLRAGVPVHVVSARAGHASPVVTLTIYAHCVPADQKSAAEKFAALVASS